MVTFLTLGLWPTDPKSVSERCLEFPTRFRGEFLLLALCSRGGAESFPRLSKMSPRARLMFRSCFLGLSFLPIPSHPQGIKKNIFSPSPMCTTQDSRPDRRQGLTYETSHDPNPRAVDQETSLGRFGLIFGHQSLGPTVRGKRERSNIRGQYYGAVIKSGETGERKYFPPRLPTRKSIEWAQKSAEKRTHTTSSPTSL